MLGQQPLFLKNKEVNLTYRQAENCAKDIIEAMNRAQLEKGFSFEQVLVVTLYVVGLSFHQRGLLLNPEASVQTELSALVIGYRNAGG